MNTLAIADGFSTLDVHIWDEEQSILLCISVGDSDEVGFVLTPAQSLRLAKLLHKYSIQLTSDPEERTE